jgi:hypothetical protein
MIVCCKLCMVFQGGVNNGYGWMRVIACGCGYNDALFGSLWGTQFVPLKIYNDHLPSIKVLHLEA